MTNNDFGALHRADKPLILFNIWDAGSAKAVAEAGAAAIATGSQSLARSQGFEDGEAIPFEALLATVEQIAGAVTVPLTVDFEAGYAHDLDMLAANAAALREAGAVGCNFEDQLIGGDGLRDTAEQCERIAVVVGEGLFVNARTDTFLDPLKVGEDPNRAELVDAALERAAAYKDAGAGCFFIPGLSDPQMIARVCAKADLPINVMRLSGMPSNSDLAALGVARISYGPAPWRDAMEAVAVAARQAFGEGG